MKTLLAVCLLALTLVGCSFERRYTCVGDSETSLFTNLYDKNPKPPTVEKLVAYSIKVTDSFIEVEGRSAAQTKFSLAEWPKEGWLEFRTAPFGWHFDRDLEVRKYHAKGKIFVLHYEDLKNGFIYHYRGQCK